VENLVGSPVSLRYSGVQPANTAKEEMFGSEAPIWPFLIRFGGPADPLKPVVGTRVFETYPVLAMIALGWMLPDHRVAGRLPKYNSARKKTFSNSDWRPVCELASSAFHERGLMGIVAWSTALGGILRRGSASRTAWTPVFACWSHCTWSSGRTACWLVICRLAKSWYRTAPGCVQSSMPATTKLV
jgi:hypothetical protein